MKKYYIKGLSTMLYTRRDLQQLGFRTKLLPNGDLELRKDPATYAIAELRYVKRGTRSA